MDALAKIHVQKTSKWNQWSRISDSLAAHWLGAAEREREKKKTLGKKVINSCYPWADFTAVEWDK